MTTPIESNKNYTIDKLWYTRCPVPTPLGLAGQLGWFNEEFRADGIEIFTLQESNDPQLRESHYDHHLLNSFRQGGNVPAIWAHSQKNPSGNSTRVIGLNWIDEYQGILSLPNSGINVPSDLRGRRLALPKHDISIDHGRASALRGLTVALELGGLSERDVEFVDIEVRRSSTRDGSLRNAGAVRSGGGGGGGYKEVIGALRRGEVDAIFVKGSRGAQVTQDEGVHVVLDIRNHPDPLVRANNGAPRPVTVDDSLLQNRPDIVARFLARVVAIGEWAAAHPSETTAYVSRETGSAEEWVRKAYGSDLHLYQRTDLDEMSIAALDVYKNFLFKWGFIPNDFDTRAWIAPGPLAEVNRYLRKAA